MSGPIVRKYGFPNFENIFGKRELEHGADEPEASETPSSQEAPEEASASKVKPKAPKKKPT